MSHGTGPLPLLVGVTGHRDLRDEDRPALESRVRELFTQLRTDFPHTPLVLLSSLAEGADQLVARVALNLGVRLHVPLPIARSEYERDFQTEPRRAEFEALLSKAEHVFEVSPKQPGDARELRYNQAGEFVAEHSQILIALWDGEKTGKTGGTSDIVDWRLNVLPLESASALQPPDPVRSGPIIQIVTPRHGEPVPTNALSVIQHLPEGLRQDAVPAEAYRRVHAEIDAFNAVASRVEGAEREDIARRRGESMLPEVKPGDLSTGLELTRQLLATADILAVRYRGRTSATLTMVCTLVFFAVVAYEVTGHLLHIQPLGLLVYPTLLLVAYLIYLRAESRRYQSRYVDYRALAEGLRVQFYWRLAGVALPVEEHYLRRQRRELNWVRTALRIAWSLQGGELSSTLTSESQRQRLDATRKYWVEDQQQFFARRAPIELATEHRYRNLIRGSLGTAFTLSILVGVLLTFPGVAGTDLKTWLKEHPIAQGILLLCTSLPMVVAAMTHSHRRAIELKSHVKQYEIMSHLFARAQARLAGVAGTSEKEVRSILEELGKEALIENGDWVLLNRDRPMEVPTGR